MKLLFLLPSLQYSSSAKQALILGRHMAGTCTLRVGVLGDDLQQVTQFNYDAAGNPLEEGDGSGCRYSGAAGCELGTMFRDRTFASVPFLSNCDLFKTDISAEQLFAMRPDGTHLRQLTHVDGCHGVCRLRYDDLQAATTVELVGFLTYSGRVGAGQ